MKNLILFGCILALTFGCKDRGTSATTTNTVKKSPQEIADSTAIATKRNFESDSPAATFDSFQKAILMGDASSAVEMAGSGTLNYYAGILNKVKTASPQNVKSLPVSEQIMVLMSRLLLPERGLKNMDEAAFFKSLVETGAIDKVAVGMLKVGNIETAGATASAIGFVKDTPANARITFDQDETGAWKVNLGEVLPKASAYYADKFKASKMDVDQHVKNSIKAFAPNGQFSADLFNPPRN